MQSDLHFYHKHVTLKTIGIDNVQPRVDQMDVLPANIFQVQEQIAPIP